jgi:hypothetical protein
MQERPLHKFCNSLIFHEATPVASVEIALHLFRVKLHQSLFLMLT